MLVDKSYVKIGSASNRGNAYMTTDNTFLINYLYYRASQVCDVGDYQAYSGCPNEPVIRI